MAIIRKKEMKNINEKELAEKLKGLQEELVKIRAQIAMGTLPQNPGRIKEIRKTIARIKTLKGGIKKE